MSPSLVEQPPLVLIATLNAPLRVALARLVARYGMAALACFDGAAALAACHSYRHGLVGVILAADLPSLGGEDLAATLAVEQPAVATFLLAGGQPVANELEHVEVWLEDLAPAWSTEVDSTHRRALALD